MRALLVSYDNQSHVHWFPMALGAVAAWMRQCGWDVEIYQQDLYHWPEAHLTEYLDSHPIDFVGLSMSAGIYQYRKAQAICEAVNRSINRSEISLFVGGHMFAPAGKYFTEKLGVDRVFGKEIEGDTPIDDIPMPAYDLFAIDHYALLRMPNTKPSDRVMPMLSGRGCPFNCNFCYRLTPGFRGRSAKSIVEEIEYLKREYSISYIAFADELLMNSPQRTIEIAEALMPLGITWECNGRLNYARPEVLYVMKKSGCTFINYGIEAFDDEVLKNMNKHLTCEQITKGIEATLKADISPGLNIIWGNIGDSPRSLKKGVEFIKKYGDGAQMRTIRPVSPYPGSPLFEEAVKRGLIKDVADFYENKHKNSDFFTCNFMEIGEEEAYRALMNANCELIHDYYLKKQTADLSACVDLYTKRDGSFRGFRQS
jgi:radical SAM superfamily enzyme YgiQ (UPF0313 family)